MKNSFFFKSLIDIFFFIHIIGLIFISVKFPLEFIDVKNKESLQLVNWIALAINTSTYIIFLRGLFFLRKIARVFLTNKNISELVVNYMTKCGNQFIYAGLISITMVLTSMICELNIEPIYKSFTISPLFLMITGLFFLIQSKTLTSALNLKNENDLAI